MTILRGNCLLIALWHRLMVPNTKLRWMRNRSGRWHCYWVTNGVKYEFYTPGASCRTYWENVWTIGTIKQIK